MKTAREILAQFINKPIKAEITKRDGAEIYTLHLQKYGNAKREIHMELTPEQLNALKWWY